MMHGQSKAALSSDGLSSSFEEEEQCGVLTA
jgi:hypothetical protein